MIFFFRIEVQEGRANLKCPQCSQLIHPNDIEFLIGADTSLYGLYQFLMVRRVLAADPDTRKLPMHSKERGDNGLFDTLVPKVL